MIFNNTLNSSSNSNSYDCSYGTSLALVESARNDLNMFKAMINIDYMEMSICKESSGYVMESEINALHEAAGKSIFKRIAEFFRGLAEKIRRIFTSFFTKIRNIFKKDKKNIDKLIDKIPDNGKDGIEVTYKGENFKYTMLLEDIIDNLSNFNANTLESEYSNEYDEDGAKRYNNLARKLLSQNITATNSDELYNELIDFGLVEETHKINGDDRIIKSMYDHLNEKIDRLQKDFNKMESNIKKIANEFEQKANSTNKDEIGEIDKQYAIAKNIEDITITVIKVSLDIQNATYTSLREALIKLGMIKESTIYTEALIDADSEEFDAIMTNTIPEENNYNSNEFPSYNELFY